MVRYRKLVLSFAPPETWRTRNNLYNRRWKILRLKIVQRDGFVCQYCGYKSNKFQIAHHIDGNPNNNKENNLITICQMCNLIEHSGQGCELKGIVDLYKQSKYPQVEIIRVTREMRNRDKSDSEIIRFLGLKEKAAFKMDRKYLGNLFGFVTSRSSKQEDDMYDKWLRYHKANLILEKPNQKTFL